MLNGLFSILTEYWYVTIPEIIYVIFAGFLHFGPGGAIGALLYLMLLLIAPVPAMVIVGIVIAVHGVGIIAKDIIGDRIAKGKESGTGPGPDAVNNGIPKLAGHDKEIQDALDEMKEKRQAK